MVSPGHTTGFGSELPLLLLLLLLLLLALLPGRPSLVELAESRLADVEELVMSTATFVGRKETKTKRKRKDR